MKITTEQDGKIVVLELDHGKATEMGRAEVAAIEELTNLLEQPAARALVTFSRRRTAKGTPVFVAGANVAERADWPDELVKTHVSWQRDVLARLRRAPVFHVVVVDGAALGWGTEFLLTADWRIACDGAVFGLPETGLGSVPGAGGTSELWPEIGVGHALRLGLTGERIGADEAKEIGLVHERPCTRLRAQPGADDAEVFDAHRARLAPAEMRFDGKLIRHRQLPVDQPLEQGARMAAADVLIHIRSPSNSARRA